MKAKTFSRLLVLLLTMTMVLSLFPAAAFAADEAAEPCTITEGCTLAAGHEGECMLAEEAPVEPKESSEPSPEVTETPAPSEAPVPTEAPAATESPAPSEAPAATESPAPSETPAVTESPAPSETPAPTESPEADKAANEAVAKAQQAIDALAQTVDGKNAESVRAALAELDKLLESMSEDEKAQLSMDKYNAAKQALEKYDALPNVAAVNGVNYKSLQAAVDAAKDSETVTLLADITGMTTDQIVTFPSGKSLIFDMNSMSITVADNFSGRPIVNEGTLTVTGNGTIDSSASATGGFGAINNKGSLTIENGTFKGSPAANGTCIRNTGSSAVLVVNNGNFIGSPGCLFNEGTATLHNGNFTGETCVQCFTPASWSYVVQNRQSASLTINGGTYMGVQGAIGVSGGEAVINGGSFKSIACNTHSNDSTFYALYVAGGDSKAHCVVNGGSFDTEGKIATVLVGNDTPGDGGSVLGASCEIKGGSFAAPQGTTVINGAAKSGDPVVTGGSFSDNSAAQFVPDGFDAVQGEDGNYTIGMDTTPAEEDQAEINGQFFKSLQNAFDAAKDGETVKLHKSIEDQNATIIVDGSVIRSLDLASAEISTAAANGKTVTFDLNGKTLQVKRFEATNGANLIIIDSTVSAAPSLNGTEVSYQSGKLVTLGGKEIGGTVANNGSTITLESGTISSASSTNITLFAAAGSTVNVKGGYVVGQEYAISPKGAGATVNMSGGIAESKDNGVIAGNGSAGNGGTIINISGGALLAKIQTGGYASCGVYHPQEGTLNITGGNIISTNGCGVLMRSGTLNISGGTVDARGDANFTGKVGDSRVVVTTSGIVFDRDAAYPAVDNADINIKGGTISGTKSAVELIDNKDAGGKDKIEVSGGSFSDGSVEPFLPEGNDAVQGEDGRFTIGLADTAVAEVNGRGYNTLQAALDAANQGETVKLLKEVNENVTVAESKDIILELNGFVIDGGTTKSTAALTNYGKVTIQDSSAAQTGGIKRSDSTKEGCYYTIKNEGNMTIAGGTVYNHAGGDTLNPWSGASLVCNGQEKAATLNITGGVLSQDNFICVKNDDYGTLNITGGKLKSNDQAVQNWNQAEISGGDLQGDIGTWSYNSKASKTTIGGSAVVSGNVCANNYDGSGSGPVVDITGGTLNGNLYVNQPQGSGSSDINVSGGSFKNPVDPNFCADNFVPVQQPDGSYGVVTEGTEITITLRLDLTGGQGAATVLTATAKAGQEASFTLPSEKPTKQFHKFLGWSTNKDYKPPVTRAVDTNKLYQSGETFTTATDVQFYAIWEKLPTHVITLTYSANGGWRAPDPQSAEVVVSEYVDFVTTQQKPYRFGYVFQGWSFSPDGKLEVRPGQTVRANADTTLYAVWALPTDSPLTGDNSNLGLWIGLMGGSLVCVAIAAVIIIKKRKK